MKRAEYQKIDHETACWDMDAGCRKIVGTNRRISKFRKEMRKHARKRIDREMLERQEEDNVTNF